MQDLEKQVRQLKKQLKEAERRYAAAEEASSGAEGELDKCHEELSRVKAQLLHQEKIASLGELTAGIAHEIKNPLNFVNNFADLNVELLSELKDAVAAGESLDEILDAMMKNARRIGEHGRRAAEIVRSMMQHSSSSRGLREKTNLNALVSEHLALAYRSRQAHMPDLAVKVEQDLSRRVGKIELVPQDIGWVVLNLVNNAMDALQEFSRSQGSAYVPVIRVSTARHGKEIEIRIEDNGPGIAPELCQKIFEPFFTTKSTDSGTGLGLSLSYEIITQGHGGTIAVESEPGKGARFLITLPDEKW